MVFHSYLPMYSDTVNTSINLEMEVAKSVAYGMGVSFCLTDGFVADSDDFDEYKLYATVFEDNVQKINDILVKDKFIEIYDSVIDSALVNYEFVNKLTEYASIKYFFKKINWDIVRAILICK